MFEEFMVEKSGVQKFAVEARGFEPIVLRFAPLDSTSFAQLR